MICNSCKIDKTDFYIRANGKPRKHCKDCCKEYNNKYAKEHREKRRLSSKKHYHANKLWFKVRNYGLTVEEFNLLQQSQNNKCKICNQNKPLTIDHDHKTDRVRGLLCFACNMGLGQFNDNPDNLISAIEYLRLK